jgi:hypothetical protein
VLIASLDCYYLDNLQATTAAVAERQSSEIEQLKNALVRLETEKRDIMLEVSTSTT